MTPGLHHLHEAGWVHRDPSPGNIIVVGDEAKISDLEFAKQRVAEQLKELTRPGDGSFATARNMRTVGLCFSNSQNRTDHTTREHRISQPLRSSAGTTCSCRHASRRIWKLKGSSFIIHFTTTNLSGGSQFGSFSSPNPRESPIVSWQTPGIKCTRTVL